MVRLAAAAALLVVGWLAVVAAAAGTTTATRPALAERYGPCVQPAAWPSNSEWDLVEVTGTYSGGGTFYGACKVHAQSGGSGGPTCVESGFGTVEVYVTNLDGTFNTRARPDLACGDSQNEMFPGLVSLRSSADVIAIFTDWSNPGRSNSAARITPTGAVTAGATNFFTTSADRWRGDELYDGTILAASRYAYEPRVGAVRLSSNVATVLNEVRFCDPCESTVNSVDVAALPSGGFVAVWALVSHSADGDAGAAFIRKYANDMTPLTPEMLLPESPVGDQGDVRVAVTAAGTIVATFASSGVDGSGFSVQARVFDSDLNPIGPEVTLNSVIPGSQNQPSITALPGEIVFVGWQSDSELAARKFVIDASDPLTQTPLIPLSSDVPLTSGGTFSVSVNPSMDARPASNSPVTYNSVITAVVDAPTTRSIHNYRCEVNTPDVTVDSAACAGWGQTPFTMACLAHALTVVGQVDANILVDASATWTGCLPGDGLLVTKSVAIRPLVAGTTLVVDCAGSGRAFTVNGDSMADANHRARSVAFADMVILNAVAPALGGVGAGSGGGIVVANTLAVGPAVFLDNVEFIGCSAPAKDGGSLAFIDTAGVHTRNLTISNSSAGGNGGCLSMTSSASSQVSIFSLLLEDAHLSSCTAVNNGGAIYVNLVSDILPPLVFRRSTLTGCSAGGSGGGLWLTSLRAKGLKLGPALKLTANTASGSGGGIYAIDVLTELDLSDVRISDNTASIDGGGIYFTRTKTVKALLKVSRGSLLAGNSAAGSGGGLYIYENNMRLEGPVSIAGNTASTNGGGLYSFSNAVVTPPTLETSGTVIISDNAAQGGAGWYLSGSNIRLRSGLVFSGNSASVSGGGLFATGRSLVVVENSNTTSVIMTSNTASNGGSSMFFCLFSSTCGQSVCEIGKSVDSSLQAANTSSPSVYTPYSAWASRPDPVAPLVMAGTFATDAASIAIVAPNLPDSISTGSVLVGSALADGALVSLTFPAEGDSLLLPAVTTRSVCSIDPATGSCALGPIRASAPAIAALGQRYRISAQLVAAPCMTATSTVSFAITGCTSAAEEAVEEDNTVVCVAQCGVGQKIVSVMSGGEVESSRCEPCEAGTVQPLEGHTQRDCDACLIGTYAFAGEASCLPCPAGADCGSSGKFLHAKKGYWFPSRGSNSTGGGSGSSSETNATSLAAGVGVAGASGTDAATSTALHVPLFYRCDPPEACNGGPTYDSCRVPTYKQGSFLCAKCGDDYARIGRTCEPCWPKWALWTTLVIIIGGGIVGVVFIVKVGSAAARSHLSDDRLSAAKSGSRRTAKVSPLASSSSTCSYDEQEESTDLDAVSLERNGPADEALTVAAGSRTVALKIMITYLQTLSLASVFRAQTSDVIRNIGALIGGFTQPSLSFHTFVCLFGRLSVYSDFVLTMAMPVVIAVAVGMASLVVTRLTRDATKRAHRSMYCGQAGIILTFLVYPVLVRTTLSMYHCKSFVGIEHSRLVSDLEVECFVGRHAQYAGIAAIFVVLYVIGIPVGALLLMIRDRRKLGVDMFEAKWAFVVAGYARNLWWYEFVILFRKVVVVVLVVFASSASVQVTLGATLLAMALAIHLELAPYLRAEFDKAECLALAALSATLVGAITLVEGAQGTDQVQINLVVTVVVGLNLALIGYLALLAIRKSASGARN
ncbi:uncharacterized protein AMSG_07125 [Thecamonas trahens ATCC 50062]|uniref:Tyrosine-protein kinase ephrin type A/B receptor-like domain-containing protein n=1 Tax=Thecamonas trahens ATCC 50062 TaxID=461836 RepID=A0A0L0DF90_THETB|nr:hypothetical protein AMSG_07125 [Thecamonas trahens ATCC 50062]KNC50890.1 hypothetical protein AMSG_07125 [Thecamonas trahens ATCC 50062]|eukprot:XP_013756596.1 hypothetical protein AMSG_07125 [Thecamonas trahens ATCC 50062]